VLKLNSAGARVWTRVYRGDINTEFLSIDGASNVYVSGYFTGTVDFDPGAGVSSLVNGAPAGSDSVFVQKLTSSGDFIWAKGLTGPLDIRAAAADAAGNLYVGGGFKGTVDLDPGPGVKNASNPSGRGGGFLVKLGSAGVLSWARSWGTEPASGGEISSIAISALGNVYVVGEAYGNLNGFAFDADPGTASYKLSFPATSDPFGSHFALSLDSTGSFRWGSQITADDVHVVLNGDIWFTGYFDSLLDFDPGAGIVTRDGTGGRYFFSRFKEA
jgi:hypothetical protein